MADNVHILFVTPAFPPFNGGGERYARSLALELAGRGHRLTIATSAAQREQDFWQGVATGRRETSGPYNLIRCPLRPFPGGRTALLAWRKAMVLLSALPGDQSRLLSSMARAVPPIVGLKKSLTELAGGVDVVHGFNVSWEHGLVVAQAFAREEGAPYVVTPFAHLGEDVAGHRGQKKGGSNRVARNNTMDHQRRILEEAGAVLALTEAEHQALAAWGIHPRRVDVVGAGVDPVPPALTGGDDILARYGLSTPFALFIGRINFDKGALHAAEATLRQQRKGDAITLALVGRTTAEFDRFHARLGDQEQARIRLLGTVDEADKHALLSRAAMLLLPSRTDSFGIVLLEAWSHGKPVIGARAGGIPSVIEEGEDGLLVPFGDVEALSRAMGRLLTDEEMSRIMGERGREKVRRKYSWERVCDRVLDSYRHVLGHAVTSS